MASYHGLMNNLKNDFCPPLSKESTKKPEKRTENKKKKKNARKEKKNTERKQSTRNNKRYIMNDLCSNLYQLTNPIFHFAYTHKNISCCMHWMNRTYGCTPRPSKQDERQRAKKKTTQHKHITEKGAHLIFPGLFVHWIQCALLKNLSLSLSGSARLLLLLLLLLAAPSFFSFQIHIGKIKIKTGMRSFDSHSHTHSLCPFAVYTEK